MAITRPICITTVVIVSAIVGVGVGLGVWFLKPSDHIQYSSTTENPVSTTEANQLSKWPVDYSAGLVIRADSSVQAFSHHDDSSVQLMRGFVSTVDYYKNETLYYIKLGNYDPVMSQSRSYPNLKYPGDNWLVNALAVDYVTGKLYAYDQEASKIEFFDIQGKYMGIVLSDLYMVQDIALDPLRSFMFILQSSRILKAGMDGVDLEEIIKDTAISAFALDLSRRILYWSKGNEIMAYDYMGEHKNTQAAIVDGSIAISSLSVLRENLYFTSQQSKQLPYSLFSCTIQLNSKGKCTDIRSRTFHDNPRQIRAFDMLDLNRVENPCKYANGGCEQLCVRANSIENDRGYSCQCQLGWQLSYDSKTCSPIDEYILYVRDYRVRGRILNLKKQSFDDAILPQRLNMNSLQYRKVVDFDYNARKGYFVFVDDFSMWRVNLNGIQKQQLLEESLQYRMYPAVDWVADQLYYLQTQFRGINESYLMVRRPDHSGTLKQQKIVYTFSKEQRPRALVVHPNLGYVFFTVYDEPSKQAAIYRINSDGTGLKAFKIEDARFSVNETGLGFDYRLGKLYWFNQERTQIQYAIWSGNDLHIIDVSMVEDPASINIHHEWMYIGNKVGLWRIHKVTGDYAQRILSKVAEFEKDRISAAKGFGVSLQPINDDHPCAIENGGCVVYCFGVPSEDTGKLKKVCGCNEKQKLQPDGNTCVYDPKSA